MSGRQESGNEERGNCVQPSNFPTQAKTGLEWATGPEHIHLLISEPAKGNPSRVMQAVKQGFARRVLGPMRKRRVAAQGELFTAGSEHVWQRRFYDFNVWSERKRIEKLRYMHRNPVKRGLVDEPEQWAWSSFRSYAYGEVGPVRINQWGPATLKIKGEAA